jgi:DNA-binding response OmpR family regulator
MPSTTTALNHQIPFEQVTMQTRVLVVDDDVETTDLMKIILEPDDFEVFTTTSGEEAVSLAKSLNPDVMVVDLLMPGKDGLEVCREVRKFSGVPILVLSAVSKPGIISQALDEGADDFLIKPMKNNVLIACLNRLARRARAEQENNKNNGSARMK